MTRRRNIDAPREPEAPRAGPARWLAWLLLLLAIGVLLMSCGCAHVEPRVVEVPVDRPCVTERIASPVLPSASLPELADPDVKLRALLADRLILIGHVGVLERVLQSCP